MPGPGTEEVGTPSGLCIRVQQLGAYALYTQHHNSVHHIWDGTCVLGAHTPISSMAHRSWHTLHRTATCDPAHLAHAPGRGWGADAVPHVHTPRRAHTHTACCKASIAQRPLNAHLHKQHPFLSAHTHTLCTPTAALCVPTCSWCLGLFTVPTPSVPAVGTTSPQLTLSAPQVLNVPRGQCQALGWGTPTCPMARVGMKAPICASVSPVAGLSQVRGGCVEGP